MPSGALRYIPGYCLESELCSFFLRSTGRAALWLVCKDRPLGLGRGGGGENNLEQGPKTHFPSIPLYHWLLTSGHPAGTVVNFFWKYGASNTPRH